MQVADQFGGRLPARDCGVGSISSRFCQSFERIRPREPGPTRIVGDNRIAGLLQNALILLAGDPEHSENDA